MKYLLLASLFFLSINVNAGKLYDHEAIKDLSGEYWRESTVKDIKRVGNKVITLNKDGSGTFHFVKSGKKIPFKWGATLKNGNTIKQPKEKSYRLVGSCDLVTLDTGKTRESFCINRETGWSKMALGLFIKRSKRQGKGPWDIN